MGRLVQAEDLATQLGLVIDTSEEVRAEQVIAQAEAVVEAYAGQSLSSITETVVFDGYGTDTIYLPAGLVTAVSAVSVGGVVLAATGYSWTPEGRLKRTGSVWPKNTAISVTYTHGFVTIPEDVKLAVLSIVRELFESAHAQFRRPDAEGNASFIRTYPSRVVGIGWKGLIDPYRQMVLA